MTEDLFIRLALLGGMAMGFSISAAHRRRAALVGGSVSNETEGFVRHLLLRACGLIERFGDAYRDYMRRTGRLVPRLVG